MAKFSFQKRKESKTKWRADFRLVDQLPDTKVVRTKFIVNGIAVAVLLGLLGLTISREVSKSAVNKSIVTYQQEVSERTGPNRKLTRISKDFGKYTKKMDDIRRFKEVPIRPAMLLIELSRIRTQDVVFDLINYRRFWKGSAKKEVFSLVLKGKGRTTADIAELKSRLAILEVDEGWEILVTERGNPSKDANSGVFSFEIAVEISKTKNANK